MAISGATEISPLVNLYTEMQTKLDKEFETKSYTESMTCKDWEWGDNETIKIPTTSHFTINDYDKTAAYTDRTKGGSNGVVQQIYDEINTYSVRRVRSFHGEIDEVPSMDQRFIRKMANALKETVDEELVPENDKYRLNTWANGAGVVMFGSADTTKAKKSSNDEDIVRTLLTINSKANNLHVPQEGRTFVMSETLSIETRLAERLEYNEKYTDKIVNGQVGNLNGKAIVAIPDDLMPEGVKIMMKLNKASADPRKCHKLRTLNNVVGSFSTHAEGLFRYDSFVKAHKANGILLFCEGTTTSTNSSVCERPLIKYGANSGSTGNELTITVPTSNVCGVTTGVTYYFCVTQAPIFPNPKVRKAAGDANTYSSAVTGFTAGTTYYVSAYAHKDGVAIDSQIARLKFTASDTALSTAVTSDD